jgi:preprotein translocase subunit SecF
VRQFELLPTNTRIDFMAWRNIALGVVAVLVLVSIAAVAIRGLNFGLDFTGGTLVELKFEQPADVEDVRQRLTAAGYSNPVVQTFGTQNDIVVRLRSEPGQTNASRTADAILEAVRTAENPVSVTRSDFVGPQVGKELAENGLLALVFVAIGLMIYIAARFEWKFALAAVLTSVHDVVVVVGVLALLQVEFDLVVLAGVLAVLGYSINDTIVVFDRVRENFRSLHRVEPIEVLNRSVNQTLSRTVVTSVVILFSALALYIFGGGSLEGFALVQILGVIVGTASSVLIACPILLWLGVTKQDLMPKARDESELARRP